jgi:hypothetical protein
MTTKTIRTVALLAGALAASGCPLPGSTCTDTAQCRTSVGEGSVCLIPAGENEGVCSALCGDDTDCPTGQTCNDDQVCVGGDPADAGYDAGPAADAGYDGGPAVDAGFDAGYDGGPLDAGFDAGFDSGVCVSAAQCSDVDGGVGVCTDAGTCGIDCNTGYDQCTTGACTALNTLSNCGRCDHDVSETATRCDAGVPSCGDTPGCDGGVCVGGADGGFACAECDEDTDCGGGFCCRGQCIDAANRDELCGCGPALASDSTNCSVQASNRVCVRGACGCTADGDEHCGTVDGGLPRLCDTSTDAGSCVDQGVAQCGAVGGVLNATEMLSDAGVCSPLIGGSECVAGSAAEGRCGCSNADGGCAPVVVGGVPRKAADTCTSGACECGSTGGPCAGTDCVDNGTCKDLQTDRLNCGRRNVFCGNPDFGLDGGAGICVSGGCQCDNENDCDQAEASNVDNCPISGSCVCAGFTDNGLAACPMGLTCLAGGCEYPPGSNNAHTTMTNLLNSIANGG